MKVQYTINKKHYEFDIHPGKVLLDVLREHGFTEVKGNCYMGTCGACTVLINGVPKASCAVLAAEANGTEITTIKGIGDIFHLHPLQKAFIETGAVQCGYCTPGTILSAYALLQKNPNPTEDDIKKAIDGNLCRCTGYVQQIEAVKRACELLKEEANGK
ncbi:MAG: (2Fe-2S)-binding protein [Candidatus Atribacteria bacterium]|nr:(2Fe-2S)-binding protein [Candidatus Atribacteria bacterium]